MDLKEFSSPAPKPWLVINGAYQAASSSNGASGTSQPAFSSTTATNVTPADLPSACLNIAASECVPGMTLKMVIYGHVQTGGDADLGIYLAQDNGAVALTSTSKLHITGATDTNIQVILTLTFSAVGAAATAASVGMSQYVYGSSPNILTLSNTTTCHTEVGLAPQLFMQWGAGGNNIVMQQVSVERLF